MIPLVEQLAATWRSIDDLCAGLTDQEWKRPTGCPGWTVQDQVSHLVDYEAFALGRPRPSADAVDVPHARNAMGRMNEIGVSARRSHPGAEVLTELREVAAARLERMGTLTEDDLEAETETPIGKGMARDLLTLRVMDTWSHEQDIRRALDRPGHTTGPVVSTSVGYFGQFLPYAVGKLAGAPDGTTAVFHIGNEPPIAVEVEGGRGRRASQVPEAPTVVLRMDAADLAALVGGRSDARPDAVELEGDEALGRTIAGHLGFMP